MSQNLGLESYTCVGFASPVVQFTLLRRFVPCLDFFGYALLPCEMIHQSGFINGYLCHLLRMNIFFYLIKSLSSLLPTTCDLAQVVPKHSRHHRLTFMVLALELLRVASLRFELLLKLRSSLLFFFKFLGLGGLEPIELRVEGVFHLAAWCLLFRLNCGCRHPTCRICRLDSQHCICLHSTLAL